MSDELRIGEVASRVGVSADTIRHYERKGLLQNVTRDASGYRRYPPEAVTRVRVVRRALEIGFTLNELAQIFRQRAAGRPPCRQVREIAARKLAALDERIRTMIALRAALSNTLTSWDERLQATSENGFAHLLESLLS